MLLLFFLGGVEAMISPTVFKDGLRDINDQRPFRRFAPPKKQLGTFRGVGDTVDGREFLPTRVMNLKIGVYI